MEEKTDRKIVIIISGEPGAGSTTISKKVAERLGLDFLSPGLLLKQMSKENKESVAALKTLKTEKGSSKKFHNELDEYQTEVAKKGNVVICGKLSIHFLKKFASFTVWLDVSREERARRTAGRDGMSYVQALKSIAEREEIDRKGFLRIYGFDYRKQKGEAALVLDTTGMSVDDAIGAILEAYRKKI